MNIENRIPRKRLAIVSTYDELCGIAGYTRALVRELEANFDIDVMDLNQYLLRSPYKRVQRLADLHIKDIARRLRRFDCVNIQLEYGTLGRTERQIIRRLRCLVSAAPALSVTFHTIIVPGDLGWPEFWALASAGKIATLLAYRRNASLASKTYAMLRAAQRRKHVSAIAHNKRDMQLLRDVVRLKQVHNHPLAFVSPTQAEAIRAVSTRGQFPSLRNLPPATKLIGTFGFLSAYKGFETAIRALRYLPDDHHLLVFGGVHPQSIRREASIDPYVARLLEEGKSGPGVLDRLLGLGQVAETTRNGSRADAVNVTLGAEVSDAMFGKHPDDMSHRIHFMGSLSDDEFAGAMAVCDAVVMSYLEVGQTSSGPIAMAVDLGCRVIASRTHAFMQFARYHPGRVEFFDIGNFLELSERLRSDPPDGNRSEQSAFGTKSNAVVYVAANTPCKAKR